MMLTLKQIFGGQYSNPLAERKVLFEEELWCIYERIPQGLDARFHLIHRCEIRVRAVYTGPHPACSDIAAKGPPRCGACNQAAPDEIVGLLKMHKWGMGDERHAHRV
jgi:hypothetical protein